jgi:hypothetical protein
MGELSKIKYYNEQIKLFEQNLADMTTLLKQQLNIIKSSLGAVNNVLTDIVFTKPSIKEGLAKIKI